MFKLNATRLSLFLIILLLLGCQTPKQRAEVVSLNADSPTPKTQKQLAANAQNFIQRAATQGPNKSVDYKLSAAELLVQSKDLSKAEELLTNLGEEQLKPKQVAKKALIQGHIHLFHNDASKALEEITQIDTSALSKEHLAKYYLLQSETFEDLNEPLDAARARMQLTHYLFDKNNIQKNQFETSRLLSKVPLKTLQTMSVKTKGEEKGWYELALVKQRFGANRNQLQQAMANWTQAYPNHPARLSIPEHMVSKPTISHASANTPRNIALLIPLSGAFENAAKAIQEGFLASYYETPGEKPNVRVYDTQKAQNIQDLYYQAVNDGADFVVGPLTKTAVYEMSQMPSYQFKTPVIALNHHEDVKHSSADFYQFSLSPEEEAEQLAEKAWQENYRLATIVVPDNNWGKRTAGAFQNHWELLGGQISKVSFVDTRDDQAAAIRKLLNIDSSQDRANKIKRAIKEKVEFQPRRREDVDLIVLAAPPEQARQLKPLFEFYYANDIPVFATSSVYHGKENPKKDRDINGIVFCDMPGIIDPNQSQVLAELLNKYGHTQGDQYARLFAMGVDAYQLTLTINELKRDPRSRVQGATGLLSISSNNEIKRQLSWAQFKGGVAQKI